MRTLRDALLTLLLSTASARVARVEVRAVGTRPVLGGLLRTPAAQRAVGKAPKRALRGKNQKALAADAAKWFGSRGYVVNDVQVNSVRVSESDEVLLLSAAPLPCGRVRLRGNATQRVRTRPGTVARRLGLKRGRPFRFDPARLAALTDETDGLFLGEGTRAAAKVNGGAVDLELTVAEPSFVSLAPELTMDADKAVVSVALSDRNVLGTGAHAALDAAASRGAPPKLSAQVKHGLPGGRSWAARVTPLGARAVSARVAGRRVSWDLGAEEIPEEGSDVAFPGVGAATVQWSGRGAALRLSAGERQGSKKFGGAFGSLGVALRGTWGLLQDRVALRAEPYAAAGLGRPLRDAGRGEAVAAPRPYEAVDWHGRKDALGDAFDGALLGASLELRAVLPQNRDCTAIAFVDAAAAADWAAGGAALAPAADAAYGLAFQANILRVDLTKRLGAFKSSPKLTLRLADLGSALACP